MQNFKLNPFMRILFGPPIICDLLLNNTRYEFSSPKYLQFLMGMTPAHQEKLLLNIAEVFHCDSTTASSIFNDLSEKNIIVDTESNYKLDGVKHWVKRNWLDALIFHLRTRDLNYLDDHAENLPEHNAEVARELISVKFPELYKKIEGIKNILLPSPSSIPDDQTLQDVLLRRRSFDPWRKKQMTLGELSTILALANKESLEIRENLKRNFNKDPTLFFRSSFVALETYFFVSNVDGLEPGLYFYNILSHTVTQIKQGVFKKELAKICIGQQRPAGAPVSFIITANFERYMMRYRHSRAYRNLLVNVSELAHKYILLATSLYLSTWLTPALKEHFACDFMELKPYEETPMYVVAAG